MQTRLPLEAAHDLFMRKKEWDAAVAKANTTGTWEHLGFATDDPARIWPLAAREFFEFQDSRDLAALEKKGSAIIEVHELSPQAKPEDYLPVEAAFLESLSIMCWAETMLHPRDAQEIFMVVCRKELVGSGVEHREGLHLHTDNIFSYQGKPRLAIKRAYNATSIVPTVKHAGNEKGVPKKEVMERISMLQAWEHEDQIPAYLSEIGLKVQLLDERYVHGFMGYAACRNDAFLHSAQPFANGISWGAAGPDIVPWPGKRVRRMASLLVGQKP